MKVLLDTNILLRLGHSAHALHGICRRAVDFLDARHHECILIPQVLYEYWVVATRPISVNGFGMEPDEADQRVAEWTQIFDFARDAEDVFEHWRELVTKFKVRGKGAHDARLVASMQTHGVECVLTFNTADFPRYGDVAAVSPENITEIESDGPGGSMA